MLLITELSMEKSIPKPCKLLFGRIFLLLPGYHQFCSWVTKGKISWHLWMIEEWKNSSPCFLGSNSSLQGGSWAAAAFVLIPWLCTLIPGVDPCVLPRTRIVPWSCCVHLCQTMPWHHYHLLSTEELWKVYFAIFHNLYILLTII